MVAPKNYAEAKKKITKPSKMANPRRLLIYGRNKKGKTTFSSTAPDVLFLDPEKGTKELRATDPSVFPITKWQDMDEAWGMLKLGDHNFKWVVVDGNTKLNNMALRHVMKMAEERNLDRTPGMVDRRDYNKSGELMKTMINNFCNLPIGVIFVANERTISLGENDEGDEENDSSYFTVPDLPAGVRGALNAEVDVIGRLYAVEAEEKGVTVMQRRLRIGVHDRYDTGFRSEYTLPDVLKNPTVPKLMNLMDQGQGNSTKKKKGK